MTNKDDEILEEEHCGECGCGHDHDHDHDHDHGHEEEMMYLTLEDDTELECSVLGIFEVEDKEYIALLPVGEEEVIMYQFVELEDDDFELISIEEEEEFEIVSEAFNALFSDEDDEDLEYGSYDDLEEEDEE